jgi:site-specific DNA-cytosine methylase
MQLLWLPWSTHVLFGGFPCGDLSTNGLQAGLTGDTDSNLVRLQIKLADECPELQWLALENVPGMLTRPRCKPGQQRRDAPIYTIMELLDAAGFKWCVHLIQATMPAGGATACGGWA